MRPREPWVLLVAGTSGVLSTLAAPDDTAGALLRDAVGLAAAGALLAAVRHYQPVDRRAWRLIAAALGCLVGGDLVWDLLPLADRSSEILANTLYLSAYPLLTLGLLRLVGARTARRDLDALADSAIVVGAALLPAWQFLVAPVLRTPPVTFDTVSAILYPLLDLLLIGALARPLFTRGRPNTALGLIIAALGVTLFADVAYLRLLPGGSEPGWLDLLWPISYLLFAAAALHPSMRSLTEPAPRRRIGLAVPRIVMLASALVVGPAIVVGEYLKGRIVDARVLGPVSALVALLVMWRLIRMAVETDLAHQAVRESEGRFRALVQHASDVIAVFGPDGRIRYASPAVENLLGAPPDAFVGSYVIDHLHPDDLEAASSLLADVLANPGHTYSLACRGRHRDGTWRWIEAACTSQLDEPSVGGVVGNFRDVTERKRAEALREGETRVLDMIARGEALPKTLDTLIRTFDEQLSDGRCSVRILDPEGGARHVGTAPSLRAGNVTSLGRCWTVPIVASESEQILGTFAVYRDDAGNPSPADMALAGRAAALAAVAVDRAAAEDRLEHQALHDPLTGLPNRALVIDRLSQALLRSQRQPRRMVGVLFLDLDRFKVINDSLGHEAGDDVLAAVGGRLASALRPGDTVARFGGDEFVVVCDRIGDESEVRAVAARIARALREPFPLANAEVVVTASIGIALSRDSSPAPEGLLRDADVAMYHAKGRGGGRSELFDPTMHTQAVARLLTERALRQALDDDRLGVHFQPQIRVATGEHVAFEALVRWDHAARGTMLPGDFIPVAEETGLIVPVGVRVLERACAQAARWTTAGSGGAPLGVSVNVSARQLAHAELPALISGLLRDHGLEPETICLEITEHVLLDDIDFVVSAVGRLKDIGLRLAIDDFGTGYSSLAYLKRFPFDELKIDASFVADLGRSGADAAIIAATIDMAHALGMVAAAEGVETEEQLTMLRERGCDLAQGFHIGPPSPADEALAVPIVTGGSYPKTA